MNLCAISFKECWQNDQGEWFSSGGFPLQMAAIGSLFDEIILLITRVHCRSGGIPLPAHAQVIPLRHPVGQDTRRKLFILANLPYYLNMIIKYVRRVNVVHTPLPGDIPLLGMLVALVLRKRLIARYGGSWFINSRTTLFNKMTRTLMRYFAGGRNVMLATGDFPQPPAPNIHWLFVSAISRAELASTIPVQNHGLSSPPRLAYIGRLSPEKGASVLIQAVALLHHDGFRPMPTVVLIGDGPQRKELERMAKILNIESGFNFKGQLDRRELSTELLQADFCVQPSLTEGFSKAWLDAHLHGLPVLTADVGSARSVIGKDGERGWIVPPNDVHALSGTLRQILKDHHVDWYALRKRCRDYVEELTLDNWTLKIGQICAQQWKISLIDGKLRP